MIGRKPPRDSVVQDECVELKGFDDFELSLGDMMRGERATMGKSLLDVQRELRIKAAYIAAIENSDPSAFDTPGFIAGYVRSYARYLNMDPDKTFGVFCEESGFSVAHGMSAQASRAKKPIGDLSVAGAASSDPFIAPNTPFIPEKESIFASVEPRAIGSLVVLLALVGGIGYGAMAVLREVQQVQFAPVEQSPSVLTDLDPLDRVAVAQTDQTGTAPSADALDRLYRPQALDVPVLVARDAPIATLDPKRVGALPSPALPEGSLTLSELKGPPGTDVAVRQAALLSGTVGGPENDANVLLNVPKVLEDPKPALKLVAVRETWVRVRSADGTTIHETTMQPGDSWESPLTEEPPTLRTGNSGGLYFEMAGKFYGPVGPNGAITSNLPLAIASLQETYLPVEVESDEGLVRYAEAQALQPDTSDE